MTTLDTKPPVVQTEEQQYEDYFGFEEAKTWYFPDGKQYIQYKVMNEGQKSQFQKLTNTDIVVERATNNARMRVDPAEERHQLLSNSVVGWHVVKRNPTTQAWEPVTFSIGRKGCEFEKWMDNANPKLIEELEKEIRKANPWLMDELSVEDIDKEMKSLEEMRTAAVKREAEKATSSSK